ncbi:MAG: TolC family outer membrane protein [Novosphingobium sp.]|nr:TolC family outer membrane protein [Novosphingobium sp.]
MADTLREALAQTYESNPTLQAARARQRGVDETVPIERAAGLPSVTADTTYSEFVKKSANSFTSPDRALVAQVQLGVPIYSGGAVKNAVKAARTRVEAGQADLRGTESAIFSQVVAAYMDVILQEAIVGLRNNQVDVLGVNLRATRDRFEIGDLTRTDVAQSQARMALAQGDARTASANLAGARETYIRLVGSPPGTLAAPPPLPNLPNSPEEAVAIALENNPDLIAAKEQAQAAEYDIDVAGAGRLPKVSLYSQGGYNDYFGTLGGSLIPDLSQTDKTAQVGARLSLPIFQGGRPAAQRRRAQALASAALESEIAAERDVIAQTRAAYSAWIASRELIDSSQVAVDAAELSLEGVRAENTVGNRTILNILDAEQELITAQVRLVTARRNAYVAGFSLLAAMGRAEARDLGLEGGVLYDPQVNYDRVRGKWFDWDDDPAPQAKATRTVDTAVQGGEIPGK